MEKLTKFFARLYVAYLRQRWKIRAGKGVRIHWSGLLRPGIRNSRPGTITLGPSSELQRGVVIQAYGGQVQLGQNVFIGEYVVIYGHGGVSIGANSLIAAHTCIVSSNHTIPDRTELIRSKPDILLPVDIGPDVWIGAGCKILGGVHIGEGCVVGAGAVVTRDLPPYSICVGNPAKVIKYRA